MAEIKSKNAAVAVTPKKEETALTDVGQRTTKYLLAQVESFARIEGTELTGEEKIFAVNTICDIDKKLREQGISWQQVDVVGCKIPQQIKRYARLGLSTSDGKSMSMCGTTAKQAK